MKNINQNLKSYLSDWTDWDGATYCLAQCLGLMDQSVSFSTDAKHVFWSDNPIGNLLHNVLESLVKNDVLDKREEPDTQYRWNHNFTGSWE